VANDATTHDPRRDPRHDAVLDGRYRVGQRVGAGGFGTVYAGWHLALERPVAIKMLRVDEPHERGGDARAGLVARFLDEGRLLTRLRHPHIVEVYDLGVAQVSGVPTPYLVMEWCVGGSLDRLLARTGRLALPQALALLDVLCDAVAHAHEQGIAHRDLKPANVMLTRELAGPEGLAQAARLIDFGIAKVLEPEGAAGSGRTQTASARSPYTLGYAAPEQVASSRTGPWTDVHALGLLFVELVTGRAPYGDDEFAGLRAVDPARPTPAQHGVDVGPLEPVLARALALRPTDRHRTARELQQALRAASATKSSPSRGRAVWPLVAAGGLLLGVAGGLAVVSQLTRDGKRARPRGEETVEVEGSASAPSSLASAPSSLASAPSAAATLASSTTAATTAPNADPSPPTKNPCEWDRALVSSRLSSAGAVFVQRVDGAAIDDVTSTHYAFGLDEGSSTQSGHILGVTRYSARLWGLAQDTLRAPLGNVARREGGKAITYGLTERCIVEIVGERSPKALALFEQVFAEAEWREQGSSIEGPDSALRSLPLVPATAPEAPVGVLLFSARTSRWAVAHRHPTVEAAEAAGRKVCGPDCALAAVFAKDQCLSVYESPGRVLTWSLASPSTTPAKAEPAARRDCEVRDQGKCRSKGLWCTGPKGTPPPWQPW
jgi:serine/threonine protein kinase